MIRQSVKLTLVLAGLLFHPSLRAGDPPHDATQNIQCESCHNVHGGPGTSLTSSPGNANLCQSCHMAGGKASASTLNTSAEALPNPGLPRDSNAIGNSHRWNSGPAGHISFLGGAAISSTGSVLPLGAYSGVYPKTYILTISSAGASGVARFSWTTTLPGGGTGTDLLTGSNVALDQGVSVKFDVIASSVFQVNDRWYLFVRPGLRAPTNPAMAGRLENGQIMCSTCHDQHVQDNLPFDPAARTGGTNHFMRIPNDTGQMCVDCHASRNVASAAAGSHPVSVSIPGGGAYKSPASLPLDATVNQVQCQTCHQVHNGPTTDGSLLRTANVTALCSDCHTLSDANARHMNPTLGVLWPGGQYGSTFPGKADSTQRGSCANCHQPHGWPDSTNPSMTYPKLLVDKAEGLCFTCHDTDGPSSKNLQAEFAKASSHPLALAPGAHSSTEPAIVETRHVDCSDCHNPHMAQVRARLSGPSTGPRAAAGPLAGVRGVSLDNAEVSPAAYEYQICLRCHGDSPNKPAPRTARQFNENNVRLEFAGSFASFHPVAAPGKSSNVPSLVGGWKEGSFMGCTSCHNNSSGPITGGTGPNGPHGSSHEGLLEKSNPTADQTAYSETTYALCFKCHSAAVVMGGLPSFSQHDKHVRGASTPCSVCHDPHASSANARLMNFDTRVVTPLNGKLEWKSHGPAAGECTLVCHGEPHNAYWY